jgi:hypothetical protein
VAALDGAQECGSLRAVHGGVVVGSKVVFRSAIVESAIGLMGVGRLGECLWVGGLRGKWYVPESVGGVAGAVDDCFSVF